MGVARGTPEAKWATGGDHTPSSQELFGSPESMGVGGSEDKEMTESGRESGPSPVEGWCELEADKQGSVGTSSQPAAAGLLTPELCSVPATPPLVQSSQRAPRIQETPTPSLRATLESKVPAKPCQLGEQGDVIDLLFMTSSQLDSYLGGSVSGLVVEQPAGNTVLPAGSLQPAKGSSSSADTMMCSKSRSAPPSLQPPLPPVSTEEPPSLDVGKQENSPTRPPVAKRKRLTTKTFLYPGSKQLVGRKKGGTRRNRKSKRSTVSSLAEERQPSEMMPPKLEVDEVVSDDAPLAKECCTEAAHLDAVDSTGRVKDDLLLVQSSDTFQGSTEATEKPMAVSASSDGQSLAVEEGISVVTTGDSEPKVNPEGIGITGTAVELQGVHESIEPVTSGVTEFVGETNAGVTGKVNEDVHLGVEESSAESLRECPTSRAITYRKTRAPGLRKTGRKLLIATAQLDSPNQSVVSSLPTGPNVDGGQSTAEHPQLHPPPVEVGTIQCSSGGPIHSKEGSDHCETSPALELHCPGAGTHLPSSLVPEQPLSVVPGHAFFGGFQTASGRSISVSDRALEVAKKLMAEEMKDGNEAVEAVSSAVLPLARPDLNRPSSKSNSPVGTDELSTPARVPSSLSTASLSHSSCKTPSLVHFQTKPQATPLTSTSAFRTPSLPAPTPTHPVTVPRRAVSVKRRPAKTFKAPRKASDVSLEEERASVARILRKFGSASAKSGGGSSGAETISAATACTVSASGALPLLDSGFSTAGGRKLSVSASALRKAQCLLSEDKENGISDCTTSLRAPLPPQCQPDTPKPHPQTAPSTPQLVGFQTASGRALSVSAASMERARKLVSEEDPETGEQQLKTESPQSTVPVGFQTASGEALAVCSSSLVKATSLLTSVAVDGTGCERTDRRDGPTSNKGAVAAAQTLTGFQTAGGRSVSVATKSLSRAVLAQALADSELEDAKVEDSRSDTHTSSGVLEGRRPHQDRQLARTDNDPTCVQSVRCKGSEQVEPPTAKDGIATGFQTAGGRKICVSVNALQRARHIVEESDRPTAHVSKTTVGRDDQEYSVLEPGHGDPLTQTVSESGSPEDGDGLELGELDIENLSTFTQIDFKTCRDVAEAEQEEEDGRGYDKRDIKVAENQFTTESLGAPREGTSPTTMAEEQSTKAALLGVQADDDAGTKRRKVGTQTHITLLKAHHSAPATQFDADIARLTRNAVSQLSPYGSAPTRHRPSPPHCLSAAIPTSPVAAGTRMEVDGMEEDSFEADHNCYFSTQDVRQILDFSSSSEDMGTGREEGKDKRDDKEILRDAWEMREGVCGELKDSPDDVEALTELTVAEQTISGDECGTALHDQEMDGGDGARSPTGECNKNLSAVDGGALSSPGMEEHHIAGEELEASHPPPPPLHTPDPDHWTGNLMDERTGDESTMVDEIFGLASMEVDEHAPESQGTPEKTDVLEGACAGECEDCVTVWNEQEGLPDAPFMCSSPQGTVAIPMDAEENRPSCGPQSDTSTVYQEGRDETLSSSSVTPPLPVGGKGQVTTTTPSTRALMSPNLTSEGKRPFGAERGTPTQERSAPTDSPIPRSEISLLSEALSESVIGVLDHGASIDSREGVRERDKEEERGSALQMSDTKTFRTPVDAISPARLPVEMSTPSSSLSGTQLSCVEATDPESHRSLPRSSCQEFIPPGSPSKSNSDYTVSFGGLQTASGKTVHVSTEALLAARSTLLGITAQPPHPTVNAPRGLQTASGKSVDISQESLDYVKKALTHQTASLEPASAVVEELSSASRAVGSRGLKTASGREVKVSESSLQAAREALSSRGPHTAGDAGETSNFPSLMTAGGRKVEVSKEALAMARSTLGGHDLSRQTSGTPSSVDKCVASMMPSAADTHRTIPTFTTAAGRKVEVSQGALTAARLVLDTGTRENVETTGQQPMGTPATVSLPGLMTASGEKVGVAESSLLAVKKALDSGKQAEGDKEGVGGALVGQSAPFSTAGSFPGFKTAGGSKVEISENDLRAARQTLGIDEHNSSVPVSSVNTVSMSRTPSVDREVCSPSLERVDSTPSLPTSVPCQPRSSPSRATPAPSTLERYKPVFTARTEPVSVPVGVGTPSVVASHSSTRPGVMAEGEGGSTGGRYRPVFKRGTQGKSAPSSHGTTSGSGQSQSHSNTGQFSVCLVFVIVQEPRM